MSGKYLTATRYSLPALFCIILTGCSFLEKFHTVAPPDEPEPQLPPFVMMETGPISSRDVWLTFANRELGFTFDYPPDWGEAMTNTNPYRSMYLSSIVFSYLDFDRKRQPRSGKQFIEVNVSAYDEHAFRYQEICVIDDLLCSHKVRRDFLEERSTIEKNGNVNIGGLKIMRTDSFSVEQASIVRSYRFYTPKTRVELTATYSILDLLNLKRHTSGELSELFIEDSAGTDDSPIDRFLLFYPEATDMTLFFQTVEEVVGTMQRL